MTSNCTVFGENSNNVGSGHLVNRIFDTFVGVLGFHVLGFSLVFSLFFTLKMSVVV